MREVEGETYEARRSTEKKEVATVEEVDIPAQDSATAKLHDDFQPPNGIELSSMTIENRTPGAHSVPHEHEVVELSERVLEVRPQEIASKEQD